MSKIPVDDFGLEVLRKAAQSSSDGNKYDLRIINDYQELVSGVDFDTITVTEPTSTSEVYTYSLSAATVKTITITYTDASKDTISTVVYA